MLRHFVDSIAQRREPRRHKRRGPVPLHLPDPGQPCRRPRTAAVEHAIQAWPAVPEHTQAQTSSRPVRVCSSCTSTSAYSAAGSRFSPSGWPQPTTRASRSQRRRACRAQCIRRSVVQWDASAFHTMHRAAHLDVKPVPPDHPDSHNIPHCLFLPGKNLESRNSRIWRMGAIVCLGLRRASHARMSS